MKAWTIKRSSKRERNGRNDGREKRKAYTKAHGLDYGGRIQETQGKGTTSGRVESLDIWTCREVDDLKEEKDEAEKQNEEKKGNKKKKKSR